MIQVSNLSKSFASRKLFENITFSLGKNEIVGLVGKNGCGKSTLFKILIGQESADSGDVITPKSYKIGYLDQHIHFNKETVLDECIQVLNSDLDSYKAEKILSGLGFQNEDMARNPKEFSGGYQLRINLCKTLLKEPDLLLLDEPTNYLDIVSLRWLSSFLKAFRGEVILITHDRSFMDSVTTHTMGFKRGKLRKYEGQTEGYYQQILIEEENYEKTRANQEKKMRHMQSFVDRFGAKASKASQAQSKLKQIQKMSILKTLDAESTMGFRFNFKETPAKVLATVEDLAFSYTGKDEDLLFRDIFFQLSPGDRVAIIGKNGKGKTTLLNVLSGKLEATRGSVSFHNSVGMAYYQQTNRKELGPNNTVADEIALSNPQLMTSEVRAICGAMMFSGKDADKKIKVLSGGEQGRVLLGKILAHPCNLLLLDEPTNHLDMESVEVLLRELSIFPGAVVFVSHNEDLLHNLASKLIVFQESGAFVFEGDYERFLEKIGWEEGPSTEKAASNKVSKKEAKRLRAEIVKAKSQKIKPLEKKIATLEKTLLEKEDLLSIKNHEAQDPNREDLAEVYKIIGQTQKEIDLIYEELDQLTRDLEMSLAEFERRMQEV